MTLLAQATTSNLQILGIIVASVMSAFTTIGIGILAYWTVKAQEMTKRNQQEIDAKLKHGEEALKEGNKKLDVIHVLTNSRLTLALKAIIALKKKAGEELTEEEKEIEKGEMRGTDESVKQQAKDEPMGKR